ncbi:hypothetical protein ACOMHN_066687 [Nucella lapillus]
MVKWSNNGLTWSASGQKTPLHSHASDNSTDTMKWPGQDRVNGCYPALRGKVWPRGHGDLFNPHDGVKVYSVHLSLRCSAFVWLVVTLSWADSKGTDCGGHGVHSRHGFHSQLPF